MFWVWLAGIWISGLLIGSGIGEIRALRRFKAAAAAAAAAAAVANDAAK